MKNFLTLIGANVPTAAVCTAKSPKNSGGGNSQSFTLRSIGAQYFTRFLGSSCRVWRYAACMLMVLFVGVGNVWGDPTFKSDYSDFTSINNSTDKYLWIPQSAVADANWISANSATTGSKKYSIFIDPSTGIASTNNTSVNFYRPKDKASSKHLTFYLTNITSVSFYAYNSSTNKTLQAKVNGGNAITLATTASNVYSIVGTISGLSANTNYTIEVFNQEASSGASEVYVGAIKVTPASTGPSISSFSPATGASVGASQEITITGSTGSTVYYLWATSEPASAAVVSADHHGTAGAASATTTVESGKTLYAVAVKDATNSTVASATYTIDATAPTLSSSTPANSATNVATSGNIKLTFSENVTVNDASKFSISPSTGVTLSTPTVSGAVVTIPYSGLSEGTEYTFSTAAGAVKDGANNTSAALSDITFTTCRCAVSSCGNATLTYPINVSEATTTSNLVSGATPTGTGIAVGATSFAGIGVNTGATNNVAKTNTCFPSAFAMSGKLEQNQSESYSSEKYLQFAFTVNSGYTFTPCDIQFVVQPVSATMYFRWEVTDGTNVYGYGTGDAGKGGDVGATVLTGLSSTAEMAAGNYSIRLYPYSNVSNTFRIGNDVILKGTTAEAVAPSCAATAEAGANKETTVGVGVAMAATAATSGYTGAWSIKAGSPSTDAGQLGTTSSNIMTFTPNTYGTYTLVWTVTSTEDGTCKATDEATVTVPAPTHGISYTNLKGSDVSSYPTTYTEGVGIASFDALADVADYHFNGWSPASIAADATTDKTIAATWVDAYNVTFSAGAGGGTTPDAFQKWQGAKFNLPGQGSMTAPSGKVFDGWKASGTKYAENAEYTMGNAAVEFVAQWKAVAQTIFDWTFANNSDISSDNTDLSNATYGTMTTGTSILGRIFGTTSIAKNSSGYKLQSADACFEIQGTYDFKEGDTIKISVKGGGDGDRGLAITPSTASGVTEDALVTSMVNGSVDGVCTAILTSTEAGAKMRVFQYNGKNMYIKNIKVIRPAQRDIASTEITLSDLKVNNRSISSDSLAVLVSTHSLTLKDAYADAPEIKFNEHTVITYADGEQPATKTTDKVYTVTASTVTSNWQAAQTINSVAYTVTAPKLTTYTVVYKDGEDELDSESVVVGQHPAGITTPTKTLCTFAAWQKDAADIALDAEYWASVAADAEVTLTVRWTIQYAASVDFESSETQATSVGTVLNTNHYACSASPGDALSWDSGSGKDKGLKIKKTNATFKFYSEGGKMIIFKTGNISGASMSVNGGDASALATSRTYYYYGATDQAYVMTMTAADNKYNIIKTITVTDPYKVTYDATTNGGEAVDAATFTGTALTLPSATKGSENFIGWYTTASEGGSKIGDAGDSYTPTASIKLYARFEAISTDARLASISFSSNAGTLSPTFDPEVVNYTYTMPYKTADIPTITGATSVHANAQDPEIVSQASAWGETAVIRGVAESGDKKTYNVTMQVAPKDGACLVWGDIPSNATMNHNASKSYYASSDITMATTVNGKDGSAPSGVKFQNNNYIHIGLNDGTFEAGDVVALSVTYESGVVMHVYKAQAAAEGDIIGIGTGTKTAVGLNKVAITEDAADIWLVRGGAYGSWNPHVDGAGVYRVTNPVLKSISINGCAGVIDEEHKTVSVTIPSDADLADLTIEKKILWNEPAATNSIVVNSGSAWTLGENTYVLTDKDDDATTYTITLTRDVAIESVTVSGETTVAAKSQITLTATVLPDNVANKAVVWSSSDETKAVVDANGVVTGKAAGSVTITATSVADGTKKGTKEITVTKFVGTEYAYWFASTTDATTNDITNDNGTIFENAPTDGSSLSASLTMDVNEVETTYSVTRRSGDSDFGTFHVPADYTANLHMLVIGSGSPRTLTLKETSTNTEYSSAPATFGDAAAHIVFANIPSGNYTFDKHSQSIRVALMVAELNSYPLTSVALEESFNLRLGQSRTPVFTLTPTKAAVVSQVWSEVSRTGANDATFNETTGEITAGTEEGTITVKVRVTDAFGNEAESGNCVVNIVDIIEQKDVTGSMEWNWAGAGTANVTINNEEALVLGNYIDGDQWAYLKGTNGDQAYHHESSYGSYQGKGTLSFKTTVPGLVTITARRWSNTPDLKIGEDVVLSLESSNKTSKAYFVPAGEVNIIADATDGMRILKIEFDANITADKAEGSHFGGYTRPVTIDRMGTVCVDHNVPAGCIVGAEVYKLLYWKYGTSWENCQMVDFEQVEEMNAGEPYMIIPTESTFALFYGATKVNAPLALTNGFTGTFVPITAASDALYGMYGIVNNMIQKLGHDCYSQANRAYIDLSQTPSKDAYDAQPHMTNHAPRKRVSLGHKITTEDEPIATGLDAINVENADVQKVLINGEMFIIRDGHIYSATGMMVK